MCFYHTLMSTMCYSNGDDTFLQLLYIKKKIKISALIPRDTNISMFLGTANKYMYVFGLSCSKAVFCTRDDRVCKLGFKCSDVMQPLNYIFCRYIPTIFIPTLSKVIYQAVGFFWFMRSKCLGELLNLKTCQCCLPMEMASRI